MLHGVGTMTLSKNKRLRSSSNLDSCDVICERLDGSQIALFPFKHNVVKVCTHCVLSIVRLK